MQASKTNITLVSSTCKLSKGEGEHKVYKKVYQAMIGSLLYLTARRSNLCLNFGVYIHYQANTRLSHMGVIKHIIKYVKVPLNMVCIMICSNLP